MDHLTKGIYVKYCGLHLADLAEAKRIIDVERKSVYREGDYGEFIAPNSILYMREKRLYVSYMREADNFLTVGMLPIRLTSCSEMLFHCYKDSTLAKPEVDTIAEDLWVKAQKTVGKELESEELKSQIRKRAREITPLLYPWTLSLR